MDASESSDGEQSDQPVHVPSNAHMHAFTIFAFLIVLISSVGVGLFLSTHNHLTGY